MTVPGREKTCNYRTWAEVRAVSCQILNSLPSRGRACAPRVRIRLASREQGHSLATIHPSCRAQPIVNSAGTFLLFSSRAHRRRRRRPRIARKGPSMCIDNAADLRVVHGHDVRAYMPGKSRRGFERRGSFPARQRPRILAPRRAGQLKVASMPPALSLRGVSRG